VALRRPGAGSLPDLLRADQSLEPRTAALRRLFLLASGLAFAGQAAIVERDHPRAWHLHAHCSPPASAGAQCNPRIAQSGRYRLIGYQAGVRITAMRVRSSSSRDACAAISLRSLMSFAEMIFQPLFGSRRLVSSINSPSRQSNPRPIPISP